MRPLFLIQIPSCLPFLLFPMTSLSFLLFLILGSSHCFIDSTFISRHKIPMYSVTPLLRFRSNYSTVVLVLLLLKPLIFLFISKPAISPPLRST